MKKKITQEDYIKANRKLSREEEIQRHGHPVSHQRIHVSKKVYNRKKMKAGDKGLPYFLVPALRIILFFILCTGAGLMSVNAQQSNTLVFISDIQEPMWVEKLVLKADHNKEGTAALFADLKKQEFAGLFLLGDMVSSQSDSNWEKIDRYLADARQRKIPVYATIGNHEYMFNSKSGREKFVRRFGYQSTIGTVQTIDSVAVVLVNSNIGKLTDAEKATQTKWYRQTMDSLDRAPGVKVVVVGTHHSPYTNSRIEKPEQPVVERFVPAFIQSSKARLFLSGHSHNLEQFRQSGKDFLVIGGGGGLAQPRLTGDKQRTPDVLKPENRLRFFCLMLTRNADQLEVEVRGFASGDDLSNPATKTLLNYKL